MAPSVQGHFEEHLKNIRKFHEDLQDKLKVHLPDTSMGQGGGKRVGQMEAQGDTLLVQEASSAAAPSVTTSFLVQNLR